MHGQRSTPRGPQVKRLAKSLLIAAPRLHCRVYARPFKVLLDKDGSADTASLAEHATSPPSSEEFDESVNWAWAAALVQAKAIVRDEPWLAKLRDHDLTVDPYFTAKPS